MITFFLVNTSSNFLAENTKSVCISKSYIYYHPYHYYYYYFSHLRIKAMDCWIAGSEFELQSRYYVHFRSHTLGKGIKPPYAPSYGLNSTTTVLLGEWLWQCWHAIKQRNQTIIWEFFTPVVIKGFPLESKWGQISSSLQDSSQYSSNWEWILIVWGNRLNINWNFLLLELF